MTLSEKSAYLKGLMEGMKLDTEANEGKLLAAIVDLLGDMAKTVSDVEETTLAISDELDEIEEDLDEVFSKNTTEEWIWISFQTAGPSTGFPSWTGICRKP